MIKMTCMDFWHPDEEYEEAKKLNPNIRKYAREFLEYGESREGYWNCDKFIRQTERAASIAELKYSKSAGWRHVYVFDHSSCQAMADDALDVNQMNVKPGGQQRSMRDTEYNRRVQRMYIVVIGQKVAKEMKAVLEERRISTAGKNAEWMRKELASHPDFKHGL